MRFVVAHHPAGGYVILDEETRRFVPTQTLDREDFQSRLDLMGYNEVIATYFDYPIEIQDMRHRLLSAGHEPPATPEAIKAAYKKMAEIQTLYAQGIET